MFSLFLYLYMIAIIIIGILIWLTMSLLFESINEYNELKKNPNIQRIHPDNLKSAKHNYITYAVFLIFDVVILILLIDGLIW